jgi:hypothetical protein
MSQRRFIVLLIAALVAISGAFFLASERKLPRDSSGAPLLPGLAAELDGVTAVSLRKGAPVPAVSLHKLTGGWAVAERGDYPADASKVRKLLLALGDAAVVEEKTADPANYPAIGVEDNPAPGAAGTVVEITAKDGAHTVIIGKPAGDGVFARRAGAAQSYLVRPAISVEAEPRQWIDPHFIDIATAQVQRLAVTPATGAAYAVHRIAPGADDYALDAVPAGRVPLDPKSVGPSPIAFGGLTADDVAAAGGIAFKATPTAVLTLAGGDVITLRGAVDGDKHWLEVEPGKDAALAARAKGRAFEIAGYRYDAIFRPLEQLLQPKAEKSKPAARPSAPKR